MTPTNGTHVRENHEVNLLDSSIARNRENAKNRAIVRNLGIAIAMREDIGAILESRFVI